MNLLGGGKRSKRRIMVILTDGCSVLVLYVYLYCAFLPFPFHVWSLWLFRKIPGQWHTVKTPRGNSSSTKWPSKQHMNSLLNPSHPFSEYQPELRLWKDSCVGESMCGVSLRVFGREFRHAVQCSCNRLQCEHSLLTSRECSRSWHLLRFPGNCWAGFMGFCN